MVIGRTGIRPGQRSLDLGRQLIDQHLRSIDFQSVDVRAAVSGRRGIIGRGMTSSRPPVCDKSVAALRECNRMAIFGLIFRHPVTFVEATLVRRRWFVDAAPKVDNFPAAVGFLDCALVWGWVRLLGHPTDWGAIRRRTVRCARTPRTPRGPGGRARLRYAVSRRRSGRMAFARRDGPRGGAHRKAKCQIVERGRLVQHGTAVSSEENPVSGR